jgi:uncharacterized repeat protein (TIGR03803 family)
MKERSSTALFAFTFLLTGMLTFAVRAEASGPIQVDYTFNGYPARYPAGGLIADASGNLYGESSSNDSNGCGIVFKLTPQDGGGWQFNIIHRFCGPGDGDEPVGGLVMDSAGNLYGTTVLGGANGQGTVFVVHPTSIGWGERVLYSFGSRSEDLRYPGGGLTMDAGGNLYGVAGGGTSVNGSGGVFKLSRSGSEWNETVLYDFTGGILLLDGAAPKGNVIFDKAGNLYGTTTIGGNVGYGSVYELSPSSSGQWMLITLYSFHGGSDGNEPSAGLVFDNNGKLYGTTSYAGIAGLCNGPGCGTVFELSTPGGGYWELNTLLTFDGSNGGVPWGGSLIFDSAGNLYGTTTLGGAKGQGVLFRLSSTGSTWTESFASFDYANGGDPLGPVLLYNGSLYGTAGSGGKGYGVIFDIKL